MRTTDTTPARTPRNNRRPAPRPAELALSHADSAIAIAEAQPTAAPVEDAPALDPEIAELLRKEEAKAAKAKAELERRQARIEAYKTGKPIPPAGSKGLPPVVKMNELGALARQLHRAAALLYSDDVQPLATAAEVGPWSVAEDIERLRDEAMRRWESQFDQRIAANAADNDTLHPLGLVRDSKNKVSLVEKPKAK